MRLTDTLVLYLPRGRVTAAAVTVALALLAGYSGPLATAARADTEPNNGIAEAEGPLSGGVAYNGSIDNGNDIDTYLFYVSGEVPLDVHVTDVSNGCLDAELGDGDNSSLQGHGFLDEGASADLTYTTSAGTNRFYLEFSSCQEETGQYSFTISPASAIVAGPPTLAPNPVPGLHENAVQAFGPLAAGTAYTDKLLTSNDQNWLTFFTPPSQETVDVEATKLAGGCAGESLQVDKQYLSIESDRWSHYRFTSPGSAQHFISVEACEDMSWEVIVKAASLATGLELPGTAPPPPPPSPSNSCLHARSSLAKAQLSVRRYRHALASRRLSRRSRRADRRRLDRAEALVRRYAARRRRQCPGGR